MSTPPFEWFKPDQSIAIPVKVILKALVEKARQSSTLSIILSFEDNMPAITNDDFTLPETYLTNVVRNGQAEAEIVKRLRVILNICMSLTPSGPDGVIIRDHIRESQQFLAKYGNALGNGFIIENVGKKFLEYADEIYSCDPELMIAKATQSTPDKFMKVIEGCVAVYKSMEDVTRLVPLYMNATEICEITAFASF